jgi:hypothetical protein
MCTSLPTIVPLCAESRSNGLHRLRECGHHFCAACLAIWIRSSRTCPSCRKEAICKPVELWFANSLDSVLQSADVSLGLRFLRRDKDEELRPLGDPRRNLMELFEGGHAFFASLQNDRQRRTASLCHSSMEWDDLA